MPRVVAVVCTYWPNRLGNVSQIVRDLQGSTRPPDRLVLLNNNTERPLHHPGVEVINAPNTTCRGKFITGLFDVADYYLFLDDDTSVGRETIAALLRYAHPDICTGYLGCWIDETGSVNAGKRLWPHDATDVTPCDTFCGCAMFVSFRALVRMVMLEAHVRTPDKWPHEGDDILLGLANPSVVVPLRGAECFVDLGYQGQAMCYSDDNYYGMRDTFTRDVLAALERHRPELP